jgi:hypothetical protein
MLYYCQTPDGNVGDDLNPWLWSRLAPEVSDPQDRRLFIGIGTLLSNRIPTEPQKVVCGAGWAGTRRPVVDARWTIYCVRGPLTARALGLDMGLALTDPAILARRLVTGIEAPVYPVSFMPHHLSMLQADWSGLCAEAGIHCIDARGSVDQVLRELRGTRLLVTESMHGAILADAFRVPWIPVRLYPQVNLFKWQDWMQSLGLRREMVEIKPLFAEAPATGRALRNRFKRTVAAAGLGKEHWPRLEVRASTWREIEATLAQLVRLAREEAACLSDEKTLWRLEEQLLVKVAKLRVDWTAGKGR